RLDMDRPGGRIVCATTHLVRCPVRNVRSFHLHEYPARKEFVPEKSSLARAPSPITLYGLMYSLCGRIVRWNRKKRAAPRGRSGVSAEERYPPHCKSMAARSKRGGKLGPSAKPAS